MLSLVVEMEIPHTRSITLAVAVALIMVIGSSPLLRSLPALPTAAAMASLQQLHAMAGASTIPVQRVEDTSVETTF
jgi:hypothetical protein